MAILISIPVSLEHAEAAHQSLTTWIDSAEGGELEVEEMLSRLAFIKDCIDDQIGEIIAVTER